MLHANYAACTAVAGVQCPVQACFEHVQTVAAQLASLEAPDDSFAGFMDAETATFASRMRRLVRSKVEELQTSLPGMDSGRQPPHLYLQLQTRSHIMLPTAWLLRA